MPNGKPAGVRCVQLDAQDRCRLFGKPERPAVCRSLKAERSMCGFNRSEAMGLLATDPEAAVAKMQRLIAIEEEKFKTRSWRSALASSAASHDGRPESDLYRAMLDDIPGHYFDGIITETLGNHPDSELAAIAIAQALKREPRVRQPGLAAVIQMHQLAFEVREKAAKALAAELQISFSPADVDGRDWTSEVGDRLYHASLTAPADDAEALQK
jgi:hypothetical protein